MGNSTSTNIVNDTIDSMLETIQTTAISNSGTQGCSNIVSFTGCSNIHDWNISQECSATMSLSAVQDALNDSEQQAEIEEQVKQTAETIAQNLDLNPGSKESENITNAVMSLYEKVQQSILADCSADSMAQNAAVCRDSTNVYNIVIKQISDTSAISSCSQIATNTSSQSAELKSLIDQYAKTVVQNAIMGIILAAALAMLCYGMVKAGGIGGGGMIGKIILLLFIGLLGLLYFWAECTNRLKKLWLIGGMFKELHWCKTSNTKIWTYSIYGFVWLLLIFLIVILPLFKKK